MSQPLINLLQIHAHHPALGAVAEAVVNGTLSEAELEELARQYGVHLAAGELAETQLERIAGGKGPVIIGGPGAFGPPLPPPVPYYGPPRGGYSYTSVTVVGRGWRRGGPYPYGRYIW